jgi:hypothetical protein
LQQFFALTPFRRDNNFRTSCTAAGASTRLTKSSAMRSLDYNSVAIWCNFAQIHTRVSETSSRVMTAFSIRCLVCSVRSCFTHILALERAASHEYPASSRDSSTMICNLRRRGVFYQRYDAMLLPDRMRQSITTETSITNKLNILRRSVTRRCAVFCRQAPIASLPLGELKLGLETNGTNPAGMMIWLRGGLTVD